MKRELVFILGGSIRACSDCSLVYIEYRSAVQCSQIMRTCAGDPGVTLSTISCPVPFFRNKKTPRPCLGATRARRPCDAFEFSMRACRASAVHCGGCGTLDCMETSTRIANVFFFGGGSADRPNLEEDCILQRVLDVFLTCLCYSHNVLVPALTVLCSPACLLLHQHSVVASVLQVQEQALLHQHSVVASVLQVEEQALLLWKMTLCKLAAVLRQDSVKFAAFVAPCMVLWLRLPLSRWVARMVRLRRLRRLACP